MAPRDKKLGTGDYHTAAKMLPFERHRNSHPYLSPPQALVLSVALNSLQQQGRDDPGPHQGCRREGSKQEFPHLRCSPKPREALTGDRWNLSKEENLSGNQDRALVWQLD